ncbi:Sedoheptulose-1,7-bisphosphatase, chloroplastic [Podospora fimiseda]|uniref:Sedoheptulose-1,7-bisphosphatase, chloroplastic n=1 Tax=Podospora fimiseda TaxID=252190 RepID=A0AAN7H3Z8_9PEZI|nr:Sedoheptulose-1,7-bisphosphatase, chloroplastic [Podospora fimiseda]
MGSITPSPRSTCPQLITHLQSTLPSPSSRTSLITSVLPSLLTSISQIALILRSSHTISAHGTANSFGDDQLNVDVLTESAIRSAISQPNSSSIITASSEEHPVEISVHTHFSSNSEQYTIAFDPLDGSSIIPSNWTVGTIIGIWDGPTALNQPPATKQIASLLGVYGPRTTAILAIRLPDAPGICLELALTEENEWIITNPSLSLELQTKTKYFSPANLRAASSYPAYNELISGYIKEEYTLRYSGGLVPDLVHALVKGHGIYLSPVTPNHKAKLRRLYELCPVALIIECAGGKAVDERTGEDILRVEVKGEDERGGIVCGTRVEVDRAMGVLLGQ